MSNVFVQQKCYIVVSHSFQFCIQWGYIDSLKSALVGVFTPRKSANMQIRAFYPATESLLLNIYQHTTAYNNKKFGSKTNTLPTYHTYYTSIYMYTDESGES